MKKYALALVILLAGFSSVFATHYVSSYLENQVIISNTTSVLVKLSSTIIFDNTGSIPPAYLDIIYDNKCGNSVQVFRIHIDSNWTSAALDFCSADTLGGALGSQFYAVHFEDTLSIAKVGNCVMGTFHLNTIGTNFTYTPAIGNIITPGSTYGHSSSYLNVATGVNSPITLSARNLITVSCVDGITASSIIPYMEADGDSISVEMVVGEAVSYDGNTLTRTNYQFDGSYSLRLPFSVGQSFNFNAKTGILSGNITKKQVTLVTYKFSEYRFSTVSLSWLLSGQKVFSQLFIIKDSCMQYMPNFEVLDDSINASVTNQNPIVNASCGDTNLLITFNNTLNTNSLSTNGSEFRIEDKNGLSVPVIKAAVAGSPGKAAQIKLSLFQPLAGADTLLVRIKTGSDGNTLLSKCNLPISTDSIDVITTSCTGIGLAENIYGIIQLYPNPANNILNLTFSALNAGSKLVHVYSTSGDVVFSNKASLNSNTMTVDVQQFAKGLYIIHVINDNGISVAQRFVKQ